MNSTAAGRLGVSGRGRTLYAAATLSLLAGLIHLWVTPEHFEEWWGYGVFFLVAAAAQILYVPIVLLLPTRIVLLGGIAGQPSDRGAVPADADGGDPFVRTRGRGGGGIRLRGRVCHAVRAGNRGGAGGSAIAQRHSQEKAHDPAHRGRRAGLGRARGAPSAARLLSLDPRGWASAAISHLQCELPGIRYSDLPRRPTSGASPY